MTPSARTYTGIMIFFFSEGQRCLARGVNTLWIFQQTYGDKKSPTNH